MNTSDSQQDDELVTSHSDENPELGNPELRDPLVAIIDDGGDVAELYKKKRKESERPFYHEAGPGQVIVEEDVFIPEEN